MIGIGAADSAAFAGYNVSMPAMHLTIPLDSAEEQRIAAAAKQIGLAPEELVKRLALEHLPSLPTNAEDAVAAKLLLWQQQDGTPLGPDVPSKTLFAQWAEEGAAITDEERDAEDRQSEDLENSLAKNRGLRLRLPRR